MARHRRSQSDLEQWINLFAKLPWSVCLALSLPAYLGFAIVGDWPIPKPTDVSDMGEVVIAQFVHAASILGQYLAPLILLLAALTSFLTKRRRTRLLQTSRSINGSAELMQMSWQDFERVVHAWFEDRQYTVATTPAGPDGGLDLIMKREGDTFLVQCKQWRANRIGVSIVRELYGVMVAKGATGGFVVGVGEFTYAAKAFAAGRNIELVDARRVISRSSSASETKIGTPATQKHAPPNCPRCDAIMVKRVARKGANAGQAFYGCSRYPNCRATTALNGE